MVEGEVSEVVVVPLQDTGVQVSCEVIRSAIAIKLPQPASQPVRVVRTKLKRFKFQRFPSASTKVNLEKTLWKGKGGKEVCVCVCVCVVLHCVVLLTKKFYTFFAVASAAGMGSGAIAPANSHLYYPKKLSQKSGFLSSSNFKVHTFFFMICL